MKISTAYIDFQLPNDISIGSSTMCFCIDDNNSLHILTNVFYLFDNSENTNYCLDIVVDIEMDDSNILKHIIRAFIDFIRPIYTDVSWLENIEYDNNSRDECMTVSEIPQCRLSVLSDFLYINIDRTHWNMY